MSKKIRNKIDNRMQWILLLDECEENKNGKEYFTEYEICSEVRIPGVLNYRNGALQCSLLQEMNQLGLYTYAVKIKHIEKEYKFDINNYSKEGYYFNNGLVGELLALFSVYFQSRFYLKATIFGEITPTSMRLRTEHDFIYKKPSPLLNFEMFSSQGRNWAHEYGLKYFLDTIVKLNQKYHQSLIQSFFWYSESIKDIGNDHQLFFIKMVSSMESLLKFIEEPEDSLKEKLTRLGKKEFDKHEFDEIKNWLKNRKISKRFSYFFQKYSDGFFKGGKRKAQHCFIKKGELDAYTKRIYDARSSYLHKGKPMYLSFDMTMEDAKYWDLDPGLGMMIDRKKISVNEKLPRARWFERLTNHCLKNFIKENT